jgi:hypothetical protein
MIYAKLSSTGARCTRWRWQQVSTPLPQRRPSSTLPTARPERRHATYSRRPGRKRSHIELQESHYALTPAAASGCSSESRRNHRTQGAQRPR